MNSLVFLSDNKFLPLTLNTIKSFKLNNKWFDGDINVIWLDDVIPNIKGIIFTKPNYNKYKTKYFTLDDLCKLYKIYDRKKVNYKTIFKIELFKYHNTYDKILFLDSDCLVLKSVEKLFDSTSKIYRYASGMTNSGVIYSTNHIYDFLLSKLIDISPNEIEEPMFSKYLLEFNNLDKIYNDVMYNNDTCIYHMKDFEYQEIIKKQINYLK